MLSVGKSADVDGRCVVLPCCFLMFVYLACALWLLSAIGIPAASTSVQRHHPHHHQKRCLATLLTSPDYVDGVCVLAKTARQHAAHVFTDYILLTVQGTTVPEETRLTHAGWRIHPVPLILPPHPSDFDRFRDQFTKLHLWNMVECNEIVYMDADTMFVGQATPFTTPQQNCPIWAARDYSSGEFVDGFNMGVFAIRPNVSEFKRLHDLMLADTVHYNQVMSEQGFLNAVYASHWCELDFAKNANLAVYWSGERGDGMRAFWDAHNIEVVHFTMSKPWKCAPEYAAVCQGWLDVASEKETVKQAAQNAITVVSAYYAGAAKHAPAKYARWGRQFMRMQAPLVFFTDHPSAVPGLDTRPEDTTHVIVKPMDKFYVSTLIHDWDTQLTLDPEGGYRSTHLYKIWLEKPSLVRDAISMNVFDSTHFVWVDYGCFRGDGTAPPWSPSPAALPPHKMLLLNVSALHPFGDKQVGGTIFGGDVAAWRTWTTNFYDVLIKKRDAGAFVGDDQTTMTVVARHIPDHVCMVMPHANFGDPWFYLQAVLDGQSGEVRCGE